MRELPSVGPLRLRCTGDGVQSNVRGRRWRCELRMTSTISSFCRTCSAMCGMELDVTDNVVIAHRRDFDHPVSEGYFCTKGHMSVALLNGAEERLSTSLERRADGTFHRVSADSALDDVALRLTEIIRRHGPHAVAIFQGTGAYLDTLGYPLAKSFMDQIGSPNYFSSMTIDQSAKWVATARIGTMRSGRRRANECDVVLVSGTNPAVSHLAGGTPLVAPNPLKHIDRFRARGGKLIVVDPRRTETAERADLFLQPFPGEDARLFAGIVKLILDNGWEDKEFCGRFVVHLDRFRALLSDLTLDHVADRTGVPAATIEAAAEMFGRASQPSAASGTGPNMGPFSNLAEHMIEVMHLVCGGYRRAGEVVPNPGSLFPRTFAETVQPPHRSWETGPKLRVSGAGQLNGEFPTALLPTEIRGGQEDRIRAVIVYGGNPVMAIGDPDTTLAAFKTLDLLVTMDPRMTETAMISDFVIAPSVPHERHDLTAFADMSFWRPHAQYTPPVVERPAGVIHDWEVFWGLARRMGHDLELKRPAFGAYASIPGGTKLDTTVSTSPEALLRSMCAEAAVTLDVLIASPKGWTPDAQPTTVQGQQADAGHRLDVCPADVADEWALLRTEQPSTTFPYRLATRRLLHTMNSAFRDAKPTRTRNPTNRAALNPEDLAAEGLVDGDLIDITSDHGAIVGVVASDPRVKRGVISMAHMWGSLVPSLDPDGVTGAHTGRLVSLSTNVEAINHMPRYTGIPVAIGKHRLRPETRPGAARVGA